MQAMERKQTIELYIGQPHLVGMSLSNFFVVGSLYSDLDVSMMYSSLHCLQVKFNIQYSYYIKRCAMA